MSFETIPTPNEADELTDREQERLNHLIQHASRLIREYYRPGLPLELSLGSATQRVIDRLTEGLLTRGWAATLQPERDQRDGPSLVLRKAMGTEDHHGR